MWHINIFSALMVFSTLVSAASKLSLDDALSKNSNITMFYSLMKEKYPDLLTVLEAQHAAQQPVTILAPSNDAFDKIPNSEIGKAFKNNDTDAVREVLMYHILPGQHSTDTFGTTFQFLPTWLSDSAFTNVSSGQRVGVVQQTPEYVFVSGLGTRSLVTTKDIYFTGGVMHVIDMPIIPPASYPETAEAYQTTAFLGANYQNLTLATLMNLTADITIFVPNNPAFQAVASSPALLDNTTLSDLCAYHIILSPTGPVYSPMLLNGTVLTSSLQLSGSSPTITIRQSSNSIFVNSARLLQSDILLANGVMHVLDNVLNFNDTAALPVPSLATQLPVLPLGTGAAASLSASSVPFTTAIPDLTATTSSTSSVSSGSLASGASNGAAATSLSSHASTTSAGNSKSTSTKSSGAVVLKPWFSKTAFVIAGAVWTVVSVGMMGGAALVWI